MTATTRPTPEELETHNREQKEATAEAIIEIQKRTDWTEEEKAERIKYIKEYGQGSKLLHTNIYCEKCKDFTARIYYDPNFGQLGIVCKNKERCNLCFWDDHDICFETYVKETNRIHNLNETTWGTIIQSEKNNLIEVVATIGKEIQRLEDLLCSEAYTLEKKKVEEDEVEK